ncbi:tRNA-specific adenosine deaminase [Buchnera aphidicola (Pterocallis alni)]
MFTMNLQDRIWMQYALILADEAKYYGEVPVGAILIFDNRIIGSGFNSCINNHDPTAHAEIIALKEGGKIVKNYRLLNTTLYVTLEPCIMCLGAILNSRIKRLVIGTKYNSQKKKKYEILNILKIIKKKMKMDESISLKNCINIIKNFFKLKRY